MRSCALPICASSAAGSPTGAAGPAARTWARTCRRRAWGWQRDRSAVRPVLQVAAELSVARDAVGPAGAAAAGPAVCLAAAPAQEERAALREPEPGQGGDGQGSGVAPPPAA